MLAESNSQSGRRGSIVSARGVALDLDGVVIDGMKFHVDAWQRAFGEHGMTFPEEEVHLLEGIGGEQVVERVCSAQGISVPAAERQQIVALKQRIYQSVFRTVPIPGSIQLISRLREYGYTLAIVTGTLGDVAEQALATLEVRDDISEVISSDTVLSGKPAPEPYLQALGRLGLPPAQVVAVENAPLGIIAAKSAGLVCVAIATYLPPMRLSHAHRVFRDIKDCTRWFDAEFEASQGRGEWLIRRARPNNIRLIE